MNKLEANKKQKKDALLSTAFDLFTSKGVNKTSISDIVKDAGVAKGTFYLYFEDKYDIRNKLIAHKANQLFTSAEEVLSKEDINEFEDRIIFLVDYIIDELCENKLLLRFLNKNLSWGIFTSALREENDEEQIDFNEVYERIMKESGKRFRNPDIMLFMIVELVSSASYSTILHSDPVSIDEIKPYLYETIRSIIKLQEI